ncbi:endonuclease/exonuclease/phosphatase family protein [Marimonas sp. MJW-29]|uniref:Endonuclease/exonuclease/phosphatase family protein n=1 Tax=Sulfitobacter sediminis TaxID=3234186 RepID=A0ABV3RW29_9RHOB
MQIATLNVQNLRLRQRQGEYFLHGAWDTDSPEDPELDPIDRCLTAELLADINADVLALQEVFDQKTLEYFHDEFLLPTGIAPYPYRVCLPGNDGRGLDVALMSRLRLSNIESHASLVPADLGFPAPPGVSADLPVFRRDCLTATVGAVTLFVCHFKSPYPEPRKSWTIRRLEALATRRIIERKFTHPRPDLWLILGDLNEPTRERGETERAISPLESGFASDLMLRIPKPDRWTYFDPHSGLYHCPDALLASPALAERFPDTVPLIVRKGLGLEVERFRGSHLASVGEHRPHASDHAAVTVEFQGL